MIYLSGCTNDVIEARLLAAGAGIMAQPNSGYANRLDRYAHWAADNGAFAGKWDEAKHFAWLDRLPRSGCLFAVAPDVYGDAKESLRRGLRYAPRIRDMGFPVAVVAQDGAELLDWPWNEIDAVFLGGLAGLREWKESEEAERLAMEAREAGKFVHMGRVNSLRRLQRARAMGSQSADGTFLAFGPNANIRRIERFLQVLVNTPPLPFAALDKLDGAR